MMKTPENSKRLPHNYQLVYDVVRSQPPGAHAAAGDIFARAKAVKATLGYSTVYRALNRLCELGFVHEVHVPGMNGALYEEAKSSHAHFVCRACGRIDDVDCDAPLGAIRSLIEDRAGAVDGITLTVHGLCADCR
jgi:Fe2+ or Zn2+ uptake regulation protein